MILARKKNMTQIFDESGKVIPVTILDYSECYVAKGEKKSGSFICLGKKRKPGKMEKGKFGENVPEISMPLKEEQAELENIEAGEVVTVSGTSKGKGFAGVVRMWGFKGGKRTHGQSDRQRHPGSIGAGTTVQRVFKGLHMGRRKGNEKVTLRGVKVIAVDTENKLVSVTGSIPGTYNSIVQIVKK